MERAFKVKLKAFFTIFKGLSVDKNVSDLRMYYYFLFSILWSEAFPF